MLTLPYNLALLSKIEQCYPLLRSMSFTISHNAPILKKKIELEHS